MLSTCQWIRDCQYLLLQGPPGVGKTHLAVALATRALENGFSVSYYHVDEWMYQLKRDGDLHPSQLKHRKYMATNLLVLDEFGSQTASMLRHCSSFVTDRPVANSASCSGQCSLLEEPCGGDCRYPFVRCHHVAACSVIVENSKQDLTPNEARHKKRSSLRRTTSNRRLSQYWNI